MSDGTFPGRVGILPVERRILRRGLPCAGRARGRREDRCGGTPPPAGGTPTLPETTSPPTPIRGPRERNAPRGGFYTGRCRELRTFEHCSPPRRTTEDLAVNFSPLSTVPGRPPLSSSTRATSIAAPPPRYGYFYQYPTPDPPALAWQRLMGAASIESFHRPPSPKRANPLWIRR